MKKFRFHFLSIKYKVLLVFSLFLGLSVFFNIGLSSYITFNRSRVEARKRLSYQIGLFQNELIQIKDTIYAKAQEVAVNPNNLADMGYLYEASSNNFSLEEIGYKKSSFLYRLETELTASNLTSIAVYTENKLSHYITRNGAGLYTTRDGKDVLISSNKKTGGRIITVYWKFWEESSPPEIIREQILVPGELTGLFSFHKTGGVLLVQAVVPIFGYFDIHEETGQKRLTTPFVRKIANDINLDPDKEIRIIGSIVFTRLLDENYLLKIKEKTGMEPFLISPNGEVQLQVVSEKKDVKFYPDTLMDDFKNINRLIRIHKNYYYQSLIVWKDDGDKQPLMVIGLALSQDDTIINIIQTIVVLTLMSLIMLFIAWLLGFYFIDKFVSPINSLVDATQKISKGNYKVKIKIKANDEIGNLVHTFNFMTKQINSAVAALEAQNQELERLSSMKSEFMANMSHELRTPLNSINANTETLLYGLNKKTDEITHELKNLMNFFVEIKKKNPAVSPELDELIEELGAVTGYINEEEDIRLYILGKCEEKLKKISTMNRNVTSGFNKLHTLLEDEDVKTQDLYKAIKKSGKHLLGLIDMILNVSEFDNVKLSLDRSEVTIRDFVTESLQNAEEIADFLFKRMDITLLSEVKDDVPEKVFLDETWTKQVLDNYLFNAIKFTDRGEVKLVVIKEKHMLRFNVYDSGTGIGNETKDIIFTDSFKSFFSDDKEDDEESGGVSLALSKRLIMMQGGDIGFESEPGKGSVFWFTLPLD